MTNDRKIAYDPFARLLHWIVATLVVLQLVVGWVMPGIHKGTPPTGLIGWHLSLGTAIVFFVALRVLWRATHRAPPLPRTIPTPMRWAADMTHGLLYALLVAVPLLGWANASSRGYSVKLFGALTLPQLTATGSSIGHTMGDLHSLLATALAVLIGLHVLGALFHQFILRDDLLSRMAFSKR